MIFVNRNGLRQCDAPKDHGPHMTLYTRRTRRSALAWILSGQAAEKPEGKTAMIDATYLETHRKATSLAVE